MRVVLPIVPLLRPLYILAPAFSETGVDIEEVQRPPNRLVDHFLNTFRARIERRDRRGNDSAHFGHRLHRANMARVEWGLAQHQDEAAAFFQHDVSSS